MVASEVSRISLLLAGCETDLKLLRPWSSGQRMGQGSAQQAPDDIAEKPGKMSPSLLLL